MQRFGQVIRVKPEKLEEYKRYHANVWPEVLDKIRDCNIQNYSIYHKDGFLFAYMEYHGDDFDVDMAKMAARSQDPGMVGDYETYPRSPADPRRGGVVGRYGRGLPYGLRKS